MNTLAGTGKLVRLILRRDRLLMPVWILALAVIPISFVSSFNELFPTAAARQEYADASADNGAFVALYGRVFGSDLGEMVAWRAGFMPIMVGLFSLLTVIRHTRTEEEAGRRELLGATVVGRHASLAAALVATFGDNQNLQDMFARMGGRSALIDAYLAGIMGLLGLFAAGYAIQATLRLRTEESSLRAEPVLATAASRLRWAGSHLAFSILGPAAALATAGLAAGLVHGLNTGDIGRELPRVLGAAMVQLPAVWVLAATAVALFGLLPRLAAVSWGALAICVLIGVVGAAVQLNQRLLDVSPFTHIPKVPGAAVSATPLA